MDTYHTTPITHNPATNAPGRNCPVDLAQEPDRPRTRDELIALYDGRTLFPAYKGPTIYEDEFSDKFLQLHFGPYRRRMTELVMAGMCPFCCEVQPQLHDHIINNFCANNGHIYGRIIRLTFPDNE